MPTLSEQLTAAIAQVVVDSDLINDIVHGPASGEGSLVTTDGGDVKTVARAIAEIGDTSNQAIKDLSNVANADFVAKAAAALTPADIDAADASHTHVLADVTDAGTAAAADLGTSAGNVVALDGSARLPAVNGSLLTGIVDDVARNISAAALAYVMAQNDATSIVGSVGPLYLADDFEADSLNVKTNATYNAAGDYYHNGGSYSADICSGGTAISSGDLGGNPASAAYANDGGSTEWASAADPGTTTTYIGYQHGSAVAVRRVTIAQNGDTSAMGSVSVKYSDDGSSWTEAVAATGINTSSATIDVPASGSHAYWAIFGGSTLAGRWRVDEVEMMTLSAPTNMTLRPTAATLSAADPNDAAGWFLFDPQEAVTFGTDIVGRASIDGGSTWATGSWSQIGDLGSLGEVWRLDADVSGQTGSSLLYEITTPTGKEIRFVNSIGILPIA